MNKCSHLRSSIHSFIVFVIFDPHHATICQLATKKLAFMARSFVALAFGRCIWRTHDRRSRMKRHRSTQSNQLNRRPHLNLIDYTQLVILERQMEQMRTNGRSMHAFAIHYVTANRPQDHKIERKH